MRQIFDAFPFFQEADLLEIRLHEMDSLVSKFLIVEADETYGGEKRELVFPQIESRFSRFKDKIYYMANHDLSVAQPCFDRDSGRKRERILRDSLKFPILHDANLNIQPEDVLIFSDVDEIPNRRSVEEAIVSGRLDAHGIHRLSQASYYYNVNTRVDIGNDFASRARVGLIKNLRELEDSLYDFRMYKKNSVTCPIIADGGWHYSYFGGVDKIKTKVAAMAPFLNEYKLFGDEQLKEDIANRKDLHHRRSEMPETFQFITPGKNDMPLYLWNNRERFPHFFAEGRI